MVTRKEVRNILAMHGLTNRFSLRTIGFSDLARCSVQCVSIDDSILSPMSYERLQKLKAEFKPLHCIVEVNGWMSMLDR